ncbi:DUF916 and DUF3324 domain-containing protein [Agrilactobacillus yilanensis]|uniref:DUF916 and DUF3324 domain-containing protein n=1 Tax=Agrilactobacillus yilanensis TaxID=2485997 RepID=A0ABW4J4G9_9LACO|nr:DUF916 and DUF3324 domain-containing protein [Agrilactobacillus yilanensis]
MKRHCKRWVAVLLLPIIAISFSFFKTTDPVQGVKIPDLPVNLVPVVPEIQKDQAAGYFSVNMTAGQTVPMNLKLENTSKKTISVRIKPVVATTNAEGTISYLPTDRPKDNSLILDFTKLGAKAQTVTLAPEEVKEVAQSITIPADSTFNGTVLGSFYVWSPKIDNQKRQKAAKKKGVSVYNVYGMYIGAVINVGAATSVNVDFKLNQVKPGVNGGKPAVLANLQNFKAQSLPNKALTVNAKVYAKGSNKVIKDMGVKKMSFAPNSNVDLPISWGSDEIQAGDYTLKLTAKTALKTWHFKKNFTVSGKQAQSVNQVLPKKNSYLWLWILLAIVIIIAGIVLMSYLYRRGVHKGQAQSSKTPHQRRRKR